MHGACAALASALFVPRCSGTAGRPPEWIPVNVQEPLTALCVYLCAREHRWERARRDSDALAPAPCLTQGEPETQRDLS